MILSVSRRTDIPAFYAGWFINRLNAGEVYIRNPFNPRQVTHLIIPPENIDCIVFWTKNPGPLLSRRELLDSFGIPYYFLFTVTPYGRNIEPNLHDVPEIITLFQDLSETIGRERVIWRYDPIIFTPDMDEKYHADRFAAMCGKLAGFTDRCIVSFLAPYKKVLKNCRDLDIQLPDVHRMRNMLIKLKETADTYSIEMKSCAAAEDYAELGIEPSECIDSKLVSKITDKPIPYKKDPSQRKECRCTRSIDIGAYNTCTHGCLYCYANTNHKTASENRLNHDPLFPTLTGNLKEGDAVTRKEFSD
jgi:hypothetical protein